MRDKKKNGETRHKTERKWGDVRQDKKNGETRSKMKKKWRDKMQDKKNGETRHKTKKNGEMRREAKKKWGYKIVTEYLKMSENVKKYQKNSMKTISKKCQK